MADLTQEQSLRSPRSARGQGSRSNAESRAQSGLRTRARGAESEAKPNQGAEEEQVLVAGWEERRPDVSSVFGRLFLQFTSPHL